MIELGSFQIDLEMRALKRNNKTVHLGSRAFDILAAVVCANGRLVTKDELMNTVWPNTVVEENNIQVHLSALRKVLGPDRDLILTVPGRGFKLLQRRNNAPSEQAGSRAPRPRYLPPPKSGLLGRDLAVQQIRAMLKQTQVLTLVGAGGVGKTSVAVEAAHQSSADFMEPVCFVELAALTTKEMVLRAIVERCGLSVPDPQIDVKQVTAALARQRGLLLLDNAEHVVGTVAQIVEALIARNNALRVLVTSREPLRIISETVFRVEPLDVPPPRSADADVLRCSAVNLFLKHANCLQGRVGNDSTEIQLVGEICRRLDGIPLAIELAAARVVALGVEGVYRRLDDRMAILTGGYRTALPRHQTLRATFDWSFAMLDHSAQSLFRRLAVFGGAFTLEAMCAVACDNEYTFENAICSIVELAAKSLVSVELDGPVAKYRLSESTRAYAMEKLQAEGEGRHITGRYASYLSTCFRTRSADDPHRDASNPTDHQQTLDDARAAFEWAFSPQGDLRVGVELASNLVAALCDAGMIEECCIRAALAVEALKKLPAGSVDSATEMRVRTVLASVSPYVQGTVSRPANLRQVASALAL